jgi:hypothetical protein
MDIYERRVNGAREDDLAAEFGLSRPRISQICSEVRATLPDEAREDLVKINFAQLEDLREKVLSIVNLNGAPVTAGQHGDVLIDPDTGETVRDYSGQLRAIAEAHRLVLSKNRMLGLDAPAETVVKAAVQYEIVGIDPEALT